MRAPQPEDPPRKRGRAAAPAFLAAAAAVPTAAATGGAVLDVRQGGRAAYREAPGERLVERGQESARAAAPASAARDRGGGGDRGEELGARLGDDGDGLA